MRFSEANVMAFKPFTTCTYQHVGHDTRRDIIISYRALFPLAIRDNRIDRGGKSSKLTPVARLTRKSDRHM